jgi:hypothetical protein
MPNVPNDREYLRVLGDAEAICLEITSRAIRIDQDSSSWYMQGRLCAQAEAAFSAIMTLRTAIEVHTREPARV